ncbi:MAG: efflux RND transporter periplasmic adaptor subunit [Desulfurivibrio sp.]|nr:MAG: efflux RND transporter periplasmic adaptor subunit [Desulfurivibrio sp.]
MSRKRFLIMIVGGMLVGLAVWLVATQLRDRRDAEQDGRGGKAAPVEVTPIEHGPITLRRTFNGTLEARAEFVVSPKVGGRVERLAVNLADTVKRGQVVAELDDAEYVQAVVQAGADLAVSRANLVEAGNALEIADREFERARTLLERGVASASQFDTVSAERSAKRSQLEIAKAQLARSEALLETAKIRLGYTRVTADWSGGEEERLVAERYIDEGHTVSANTALLLIVELDPITGVIFVTEEDYARLRPGQTVMLSTDAYPGEEFAGVIDRISPVFRQDTRQARVELTVANHGLRLKPGMFIRSTVELARLAEATIVAEQAITSRDDRTGIFVVDEEKGTVSWRPVRVGIREEGRVQIEGEGLAGRAVSLGHQLIEDGSAVIIAEGGKDPARQGAGSR